MQIGFATYRDLPQGADDDQLVADALRRMGLEIVPIIWDAPGPTTTNIPAMVVRSCWDYHYHPDAFVAWAEALDRQGIRLFNSSALIKWNIDKHYLSELAAYGVALPKTVWVERGAQTDLATLLRDHDLDAAVIKPVISLSAYKTWRTSLAEARAHQAAFAQLVAEQGAMVQAFIADVATKGELSLVFLGGSYSHTVCKRPRDGDFRVQADFGGTRTAM